MVVGSQTKVNGAGVTGKRPPDKVFVNRQPVYGTHVNLLAYELLSQVRESGVTNEVDT